ncbi:tetratricopeptide repeat protein [Micromonospora endolithica]|uniref:Tetratricopeptide repeat protein n=1 Tax=Micromonospora endolithica TaxID=230091 RepID=A0A3A9YV78_9ACTN|nr:tetratricopeptide repeat protein [Micromonospora endolithica]RKN39938.1 tetratricopeptide repeat protein [Micromonospora endolithica]TWJ26099.1 tetratricopeptide repeat protein [Micromonospora endolithica]
MAEDDRVPPAAEELALARRALDAGDLEHAAGHVAAALAQAPTLPEVHETLARLGAAGGASAVDLFPLHHRVFVGTVVARAHLLAAAGHPAEGLDLLVAATHHAPGTDWAAVPWVTTPDLAERLDPERTARILMQVCAGAADPVPRAGRASLTPYLTLARNAVTVHPEHGLLLGAASALARRLGEVPLAIRWADRGVRAAPSKIGEVWLGYAYRSGGRNREALAALRRAVAHDPDDLAVYADIAGTLADDGHLDEALEWIDRALARDPSFDCAVHTAHRLRHQRDGDVAHLVALADFVRDHPDDTHEHGDLAECCRGRPWLGQVTPAGGPAVDVMRQVLADDHHRPGGPVRLAEPAPPSALRTLVTTAPGLRVDMAEVGDPDPREPRRPTTRQLWRWTGTTVEPAVPAPSPQACERLRQLAHPAWPHPPAAYDAAVGLATVDLTDLLGLLVHPPDAPPTALGRVLGGQDPVLWVRSVQVWACLGLLHHRTDEPWATSTRRRVLLDLVWGIEDWITEAALFALVTAAWVHPAVRPDVAGVMAERLADVAEVGRRRPVPIAVSVAHLALATPDLAAESRALAAGLAGVRPGDPAGRGPRALVRRLLRFLRRR